MPSNDQLLIKIIEQDMKLKKVDCYYLEDVVELDPTEIKVGGNEAVYVHLFVAQGELFGFPSPFYVEMQSASNIVNYQEANTSQGRGNQITKHYENIQFKGIPFPLRYYVHYVRVKF